MLDADGTYPAEAIPELLTPMASFEQVNGARTSEQGSLRLLRVPAKYAIRKLASYLCGRSIPDLNTGLKAFKRDAAVPGFRKGHAPLALIEKRFAGDVGEQLKSQLIGNGYL